MKFIASLAALLFFPLAVMFATERYARTGSLALMWFAVCAAVVIVGLVLGYIFGRGRAFVMFAAGAVPLFIIWLPLQILNVPESDFSGGAAYFLALLLLAYCSLHGGGLFYLSTRRGT